MRYLIYPETEAKLRDLEDRMQELPYIGGPYFQDQIVSSVEFLKKHGFYEHFPEEYFTKYKETMNSMINEPEKHHWKLPHTTIPCDFEDMMHFTGDPASIILTPNEIWDYTGFSSPIELVTGIGAIIQKQQSHLFREGYKWTKERDGKVLENHITGDMNADLRVIQKDITQYKTTDPFGYPIGLRPELPLTGIAAYHSTEPAMFVAVMKYMDQMNIEPEDIIEYTKSFTQKGGFCTEHLCPNEIHPEMLFVGYDIPLQSVFSNYWLITAQQSAYGAFLDGDDLVFKHEGEIEARFSPDEANHLLKGLIYQAASGLGRVPARQLIQLIEFNNISNPAY